MAKPEYEYQNLHRLAEGVKSGSFYIISLSLVGLVVGGAVLNDVDSKDVEQLFKHNAGISEPSPAFATPISQDAFTPQPQQVEQSSSPEGSTCASAEVMLEGMFEGKYSSGKCEPGSTNTSSEQTTSQSSGVCGTKDDFVDDRSDIVTVQTEDGRIFQATLHGEHNFTAIESGGGERASCRQIVAIQP